MFRPAGPNHPQPAGQTRERHSITGSRCTEYGRDGASSSASRGQESESRWRRLHPQSDLPPYFAHTESGRGFTSGHQYLRSSRVDYEVCTWGLQVTSVSIRRYSTSGRGGARVSLSPRCRENLQTIMTSASCGRLRRIVGDARGAGRLPVSWDSTAPASLRDRSQKGASGGPLWVHQVALRMTAMFLPPLEKLCRPHIESRVGVILVASRSVVQRAGQDRKLHHDPLDPEARIRPPK